MRIHSFAASVQACVSGSFGFRHDGGLVAVQNDLVVSTDFLVHQELLHQLPLVPLQLNDFAFLLILDQRAVAMEILSERLQYLLGVQIFCQALSWQRDNQRAGSQPPTVHGLRMKSRQTWTVVMKLRPFRL